MKVCDICGAFLVVGDTEKRTASHLEGKQHIGFELIRKTTDYWKVIRLIRLSFFNFAFRNEIAKNEIERNSKHQHQELLHLLKEVVVPVVEDHHQGMMNEKGIAIIEEEMMTETRRDIVKLSFLPSVV